MNITLYRFDYEFEDKQYSTHVAAKTEAQALYKFRAFYPNVNMLSDKFMVKNVGSVLI